MTANLVRRWAALNGLTITDQPFGLHQLADDPPAGAKQVQTPNIENAVFLVDEEGRPAAVVFVSYGGQWMATMGELCRWMRLSAFRPPAPRDEADKHFIVVSRPGAVEPRWLREQQ